MMILLEYCILFLIAGYVQSSALGPEPKNQIFNLNPSEPDESVLHPDVQVITINGQLETDGSLVSNPKPDVEELQNGEIPNNRNLLQSALRQLVNVNSYAGPLTIEVLIVCDKEFSDKFNQDRKRILDYWTVYFWDVNMRFKTLPSSQISFRVNAVIIMAKKAAHPFIEGSCGADGLTNKNRILDRFSPWVYANMNAFPKFDIAIAVTNAEMEVGGGGGLAWTGWACNVDHAQKIHYGTLVFNDAGDFGSITTGSHEIAHFLGAPHDDASTPLGYIMNGGSNNLRYFFSPQSDQNISNFAKSDGASCLRVFGQSSSEIPSDFSGVQVPTMLEQCRRRMNNPNVYVNILDAANCSKLICKNDVSDLIYTSWLDPPIDNTPCLNGRCFRGRCRKVGKMLVNVGSNLCTKVNNPFSWAQQMYLVPCPSIRGATPMDQFVIEEAPNGNGLYFETTWNSPDGTENGDRCLYTGNAEGGRILTDRCNFDNPWHGWQMVNVGSIGEFLLKHKVTRRCAKKDGGNIATYIGCNANDPDYRWKLV